MSRQMRGWPSTALFLASYLLLCGQSSAAQDTVVVSADRPAQWGRDLALVEERRVGAIEGSDVEAFGRLTAAAVGPNGDMVVVDQLGPVVRMFDPQGRYLRDLGRAGAGPGEYSRIAGICITRSGQIALWDPSSQRVSLYGLDGTFARSFRAPSSVLGGEQSFQVDTAGSLYVRAVGALSGHVIDQYQWIRLDSLGGVIDSIPVPRAEPEGRPLVMLTSGGTVRPFLTETVAALSPLGYQVTGRTNVYALWRPLPDGRVVRIERSVEPVAVGKEERQQWTAILRYIESLGAPGAQRFSSIPAEKPAFKELWIDEEGRVWVHRYSSAVYVPPSPGEKARRQGRPGLDWIEPPVWDVLSEKGAFLGTVRPSLNAFPVAARGAFLWVVEHGELGEDYLVRYRIQQGG
jgi:hypothetical protein